MLSSLLLPRPLSPASSAPVAVCATSFPATFAGSSSLNAPPRTPRPERSAAARPLCATYASADDGADGRYPQEEEPLRHLLYNPLPAGAAEAHAGHGHGEEEGATAPLPPAPPDAGLRRLQGIYTISIFVVAAAGGLGALLFMDGNWLAQLMPFAQAFAGGVFLAVGMLHLVPDALKLQAEAIPGVEYPVAPALIMAGILLLVLIERVVFHAHVHMDVPEAALLDHHHDPLSDSAKYRDAAHADR